MSQTLTLGEYIRRLRRRSKKSLNDLYDETGISVSNLSRIENDSNMPNVEAVVKLAKVLDGDLDLMLEQANCLPKEILERLTRRATQGTPVMRRTAGAGEDDDFASALVDDMDPALRVAIAKRFNIDDEDAAALFNALAQVAVMTEQQRDTVIEAIALMAKGATP